MTAAFAGAASSCSSSPRGSRSRGRGGRCEESRSRSRCASSARARARCRPGRRCAADECKGLRVCLPVAGPWVVVPPGGVDYELACPLAGYIVGGTDARVAARDVDVSFRGEPGSPVGPGVTTRRSVVFHAVRDAARVPGRRASSRSSAASRRSGGGGRALTGVTAAGPPASSRSQLFERRRQRAGPRAASQTVRAACPAGRGSSARRTRSPSVSRCRRRPRSVGAVRVRRAVVDGVVVARVTRHRPRGPAGSRCRSGRCARGRDDASALRSCSPRSSVPLLALARLPLDRAPAAAGGDRVPEPRGARLGRGPVELEASLSSPGCCSATIALLCVAVARPRLPLATTADRATVVLVVDVSVSMNATDVAPSRLEAARAAITSFVDQRARTGQGRARRVRRRPRRRHRADDRPASC